jgi:hypothetical protein
MPAKLPRRDQMVQQLTEAGVDFDRKLAKRDLAPIWRAQFDPEGTPPKRSARLQTALDDAERSLALVPEDAREQASGALERLEASAREAVEVGDTDEIEDIAGDFAANLDYSTKDDKYFAVDAVQDLEESLSQYDTPEPFRTGSAIDTASEDSEFDLADLEALSRELEDADAGGSTSEDDDAASDSDESQAGIDKFLQELQAQVAYGQTPPSSPEREPVYLGEVTSSDEEQPRNDPDHAQLESLFRDLSAVAVGLPDAEAEVVQAAIDRLGEETSESLDAGADAGRLATLVESIQAVFEANIGSTENAIEALTNGQRVMQQQFGTPDEPSGLSALDESTQEAIVRAVAEAGELVRLELATPVPTPDEPSLSAPGFSSIIGGDTPTATETAALNESIAAAERVVAADPTAAGEDLGSLAKRIKSEVKYRQGMDSIKDRLTNPTQAAAFSNATRQTPRLLRLIAQGVYAPTAFTGTAGKAAAMKIEQQLAYAERQKVGTRRAADPIVVRERPTRSNPNIRRWRRPRFTTSTVPR